MAANCRLTELVLHTKKIGDEHFKGAEFEGTYMVMHDALSSWYSTEAQSFCGREPSACAT